MMELGLCILCAALVVVTLVYVLPWAVARLITSKAWQKFWGRKFLLGAFCFFALSLFGAEAVLNIERRGGEVVLFVTGGTSNVQYQVWTAPNPDHNIAATNWYYWRRAYSASFHPYSEMVVYGELTSKQPQRFFQIRGVLPDLATNPR